jgi:hypothetical protein
MSDAALTAESLTGYTQIATTGAQTYNNCNTNMGNPRPTICGQYVEDIFQNNTNHTLDFVYQFSNGYARDGVDTVSVSYLNDQAGPEGCAGCVLYEHAAYWYLPGNTGVHLCRERRNSGMQLAGYAVAAFHSRSR